MIDTVTVILNGVEASQFKDFQRHHELFKVLQDKGAFDVKFGKVTLNIAFGQVQNVVKEEVIFKR